METGLSRAVAVEIRVLLLRREMSQAQLAERLGVNEMWVSRRLRGAQHIDLNDLQRIADALDVPVLDLFPRELVRPNARSEPHAVDIRLPDGAARRRPKIRQPRVGQTIAA